MSAFKSTYKRAIFAAALIATAFPPFGLWPLALFGLAVLAHGFLERPSPREGAWLLGCYSFAVNVFGYYWIAYVLCEFGSLPWIASIPITIVMFMLMSLVSAGFGWGIARVGALIRPDDTLGLVLWIAAGFLLWDGFDPRPFPWTPAMSVGSVDLLMASVFKFGTWGWRLIFCALASYLAFEYQSARGGSRAKFRLQRAAAVVAVTLLFTLGVGYRARWELAKRYAARQPVTLLQGNVGNYEKKMQKLGVMPTRERVFGIYNDLVEQSAIHWGESATRHLEPWTFWPETSYPGLPTQTPEDKIRMSEWAQLTRGLHIVGSYESEPVDFDGRKQMLDFNIAALFHDRAGYVGRYQKVNRLAFGEYIPGDTYFPGLYKLLPAVNHFGAGTDLRGLAHPEPKGPVFIPLICYEVLFEGFVDRFVKEASRTYPDRFLVLVNPANDSWYGPTSEPFQNALLTRWAAARVGLPMLRPTNTGLSLVIAPWGEALDQGPRDEIANIYGLLPVPYETLRVSNP